MRAIEIAGFGGPDVLRLAERPVPELRAGEVLVRVAAAGVNRPDIMQRQGKYPPPPGASDIPGLEISGEVVAGADGPMRARASARSSRRRLRGVLRRSDRAMPADPGGTARPSTRRPFPRPSSPSGRTSSIAAACKTGERVLVHGGTSGIGTTAIQLAHAFGATVLATAGSPEKMRRLPRPWRGARDRLHDAKISSTPSRRRPAATVSTSSSTSSAASTCRAISRAFGLNGRLVQIGLMSESKSIVDLRPVLQRRLTITGSTLRPRGRGRGEGRNRPRAGARGLAAVGKRGDVRPIVHASVPARPRRRGPSRTRSRPRDRKARPRNIARQSPWVADGLLLSRTRPAVSALSRARSDRCWPC